MLEFVLGIYLFVTIVLLLVTSTIYVIKSESPQRWQVWLKLCATWPQVFWSVSARETWKTILGIK